MRTDDTAIVKQAFAAFAARDLGALETLSSVSLVVTNPPTGSALGQQVYEGRSALARYLSDVERVWDRLELRPETFHSPRRGEVLVKGSAITQRDGASQQMPVAWSWRIINGEIASVRVLPTAAV
ncbi:MAG TPA: nuclear transport factor 2 family protein [Solirubrobacteraceae bacterium]|jgi:ketosteroid isomerase-like protein